MKRLLLILATVITQASAEEKPVIAVYDIVDRVSESGMVESSFLSMDFDTEIPMTFHDLTLGMEQAATDPNVQAIVLDIDDAGLSFAQLVEIREHLLLARESGKDVWLYSDYYENSTALLGSAASQFVLMPEADVMFSGLHVESMYFKGALDKLGLEADVIHIGDYKSFGEEFYRVEPSDFAKKQSEQLVGGIFNELVNMVADGRKIEREKLIELVNAGTFSAEEAKAAGLVDDLKYRTEFNTLLREQYADASFEQDYGVPTFDGPEVDGIFDLFKLMFSSGDDDADQNDYVAVVVLEGGIDHASITPVRDTILEKLKDEKAKGLVLRVDSPGGSALASEVLWEATSQWKESGKPFAVSFGEVAASGGYYVSAGADRIFAQPGTITGSIGVVGMKFVVGDALEKIGITTHSTKRGKHADVYSMTSAFTPEQAKLIRQSMLEVYETFKKRIEDGRGDRLQGEIESLAGGRVYIGRHAQELGLVDEIGGLRDAIDWVAQEAEMQEVESILSPRPKSFFEGLFSDEESDEDGELVKMGRAPAPIQAMLSSAMQDAGLMALPEDMRIQVRRALRRLVAAGDCQIQLLGPDLRANW